MIDIVDIKSTFKFSHITRINNTNEKCDGYAQAQNMGWLSKYYVLGKIRKYILHLVIKC